MVCGSARAALGNTVCSVASGRAVCGHVGGRAVCGVAGGACTEFVGIACSNGKFVSIALSPGGLDGLALLAVGGRSGNGAGVQAKCACCALYCDA